MKDGQIVFTDMDRVIFGRPAADAIVDEAARLGAERVFLLTGGTLNRETDEVARIQAALGPRCVGLVDHMPEHSPREAVLACAAEARAAGADLLVTFGGGSVTDGGKVVTICLEHGIDEFDGLEPFRSIIEGGKKHIPPFAPPTVRQICVPTTLSGGEHNARAGCTNSRLRVKQSYENRGIVPVTVILDPAPCVHTPEWLWLSTGIRAFDHAVETVCSLDANPYTDGTALHAIRVLGRGLAASKADGSDLAARLDCLVGAWLSMVGVVSGVRMGGSHAIGHILGGTADVPHGYTSCVMLPHVLEYNASVNGDRQAMISEALGRPGTPAGEAVADFIARLGLPRSLAEVGVGPGDFELIAKNTMNDAWTYSNPRKIAGPEDVMDILRTAAG